MILLVLTCMNDGNTATQRAWEVSETTAEHIAMLLGEPHVVSILPRESLAKATEVMETAILINGTGKDLP